MQTKKFSHGRKIKYHKNIFFLEVINSSYAKSRQRNSVLLYFFNEGDTAGWNNYYSATIGRTVRPT